MPRADEPVVSSTHGVGTTAERRTRNVRARWRDRARVTNSSARAAGSVGALPDLAENWRAHVAALLRREPVVPSRARTSRKRLIEGTGKQGDRRSVPLVTLAGVKTPPRFESRTEALQPLVVAAKTDTLAAACEILFTHGSDLTWGASEAGLFLVDSDVDDEVDEALDMDSARGQAGMLQFVRSFVPLVDSFIVPILSEVERIPASDKDKRTIAGALASARLSAGNVEKLGRVVPELVARIPSFAGWLASTVARSALDLRSSQHTAIGLDDDDYDEMLYAARRLDVLMPLARIVVRDGGLACELGLAGAEGFSGTSIDETAHHVEVLRLRPWLAELKQGRDIALQLFVAQYINTHTFEDSAFPCAVYGNAASSELDVVIPRLDVGIEIKLSQAPTAIRQNKLDGLGGELARQLAGYFALGCRVVFVVTNLDDSSATYLESKLKASGVLTEGRDAKVIGGRVQGLTHLLDGLLVDLKSDWDRQIHHKVEAKARANEAAARVEPKSQARRKAAK